MVSPTFVGPGLGVPIGTRYWIDNRKHPMRSRQVAVSEIRPAQRLQPTVTGSLRPLAPAAETRR
jgi:hypothetical protein